MPHAIDIENLSRWYGRHRGVDGITLQVPAGEVFGFLGPNGAGKTTTIRVLLGFIRASGGRAEVFGMDCATSSIAIRRRTGYLPGEYSLYNNLTGREVLRYLGNLRGRFDHREATRLARHLDCDLSRPVRDLSHGNRQKVAIVGAFMHHPDLLILDEPTSGLDPVVQKAFHGLVESVRDHGATVFLSSHVLSEVERLCQRVAVIREGRIVSVESVADIRARQVRRVAATLDSDAAIALAEALRRLASVSEITRDACRVEFTARGSMGPVLALLVQHGATDLTSHEPRLEEYFFGSYREGADE